MTIGGRELRRPEEGWTTVVLVYVLALVLGWTVDEPAWVNGRGALTDGLPLAAALGATFGLLGPKVGWGRWTTHMIGALFAGLLVPILAGLASAPGASIVEAFGLTAEGTTQAYLDLAWRDLLLTNQEVHYTLVLAGLVWGTMQFASYAVFGHRRPLAAVVVVGIVTLGNMALYPRDQVLPLLLYTAASLFLLIQMHAFDERSTWVRRRIGDPSQLSALYLRGGTVFIVIAMTGSLVLTTRAASAPLAGAWEGVVDGLYGLGEELARFLPAGADVRGGGGVSFGSTAKISPRWVSDDGVAFTATVPPETEGLKWRAATYDTFTLGAWVQTAITLIPVEGAQPLLAGRPEEADPDLMVPVQLSVSPDDFRDTLLLSPGTPVTVSRTARVLLFGDDGWFAGVDLGTRSPYEVTAAIPLPEEEEVITQNLLRAANETYPPDVTARYTAVPEGAIGNDARELLEVIRDLSPSQDPYDLAITMEAYLRSDETFTYDNDLTDDPSCEASAVECFARLERGYCLHYASTLAILLREMHPENRIPTRLVQGFLPGERVNTFETVRNLNAHAWVEVYFPGFGWVPFDPTGGGIGIPSSIPVGPEVPSQAPASPGASPGFIAFPSLDPNIEEPRPGGLPQIRPRDDSGPLFIVLALILALSVVGIAIAAWLRGPRGEVSPESAWQGLSRTASRFGFAPRPTQTVYEYAASLGELVPAADADLQTVALAKVETSYARVRLPGARMQAVRDATRRLRISMLRLVLRRPRRRRR